MAKEARDGTIYVRQQKGHSVILGLLLCCTVIYIPIFIYHIVSPNHYFHL